jgi:hypothetical protein
VSRKYPLQITRGFNKIGPLKINALFEFTHYHKEYRFNFMIPGFEKIVEERIKKAQQEGEFDNLEGTHKPLKFEDQNVPEEFRLAHKILKNSGFLPPELELRKNIRQTEDLLQAAEIDSPERIKIQKKLSYLVTKLNTLRGDRCCSSLFSEEYRESIIKKMS